MGVRDLGSNLHGEVRLVLPREHTIRHLIEYLRQFSRVVLADGEYDRFSALAAHRIMEGVFKKSLAENLVRGFSKEPFLKLPLLKSFTLASSYCNI